MENQNLAVHRTIVAVDVEGFGDRHRTNRNQLAIRDGLYGAMREAFQRAGIPWNDRDHEDRGDGDVHPGPARKCPRACSWNCCRPRWLARCAGTQRHAFRLGADPVADGRARW